MQNEDIAVLFALAPIKTTVDIIHEPNKVAVYQDSIYLESYHPLTAIEESYAKDNLSYKQLIENALHEHPAKIDWDATSKIVKATPGMVVKVGSFSAAA